MCIQQLLPATNHMPRLECPSVSAETLKALNPIMTPSGPSPLRLSPAAFERTTSSSIMLTRVSGAFLEGELRVPDLEIKGRQFRGGIRGGTRIRGFRGLK